MNNFKILISTLSFFLFSSYVLADNLIVNITGETDFCFGASTTICADSNPNYSYQWSTGQTTACIDVFIAGFFSVTVSDGVCSGSTNVNITTSSLINPVIFGEDLCIGSVTTLSTGVQYDTYQWISPTGQNISSLGSPWEIEVAEPGFYTLNVTQGSCSATTNYTLFGVEPPTAIVENNIMVCNAASPGGTNILDLSQIIFTESDYTILDPNCLPLSSSIVDFEGQFPGVYTYKYVLDADFPCEEVIYSINIIVENCDCSELTFDNIGQCESASTLVDLFNFAYTLSATEGNFSLTDTQGNLTSAQPDSNGILMIDESLPPADYTLTYTLDNPPIGCPSSSTSIFKIFPLPQIALADPEPLCISDTLASEILMHLDEIVLEGEGFWSDEQGNPLTPYFAFIGPPQDTMNFLFNTNNATGPCSNFSTLVTLEFIECIESSVSKITEETIKVYPNPSNDEININTEYYFDKIQLLNIYGQEVINTSFNHTLDISQLNSGIYYLKLTNSKTHTQQCSQIIKS